MKAYEPARPAARHLRSLYALVCLSGLGLSAQAQSNAAFAPVATSVSNGYVMSYPAGAPAANSRTYSLASGFGRVAANDPMRLVQPGAGVNVNVTRTIPWSSIARGAAGAAWRALPWVGVAVGVCALLDSAGVQCPPGGGGALVDPGAAQQSTTFRRGVGTFSYPTACGSGATVTGEGTTVSAAAADMASKFSAAKSSCSYTSGSYVHSLSWTYAPQTCGASSCTIVRTQNQTSYYTPNGSTTVFNPSTTTITPTFSNVTETKCPAGSDGRFPAPYRDGSCPTPGLVEPASEDELADLVEARAEADQAIQAVRDLIANGQPVPVPDGGVVTGPASVPGTSTTSVGPNGTTTTTTSYDMDYGIDWAGWGRVETGTDINGNPTTTTTTGTDNAEDGPGLCELYPDILACAKLGETPADVVPKETRSVDYQSIDIGAPSGCPASVPLPNGDSFSYAPLCDNLTTIRPLIIAIGFFMAALIIVRALKA